SREPGPARRTVGLRAARGGGNAPLRTARQLEARHRELPRVLPLPDDPPGAVPGLAEPLPPQLPRRAGRVDRGRDGAGGRRRNDESRRSIDGRPNPALGRPPTVPRPLCAAVPEPPAEPASGLCDDTPARARVRYRHPRRVPVAVPAGSDGP